MGRECDEVRDEAHGEVGEAGGEGQVRRHLFQGGRGRELEVDGRVGETGVRAQSCGVLVECTKGAGNGDIESVRGDAEAAREGGVGAETVQEVRDAGRVRERDKFVVEQDAPLLRLVRMVVVVAGGDHVGHGG